MHIHTKFNKVKTFPSIWQKKSIQIFLKIADYSNCSAARLLKTSFNYGDKVYTTVITDEMQLQSLTPLNILLHAG